MNLWLNKYTVGAVVFLVYGLGCYGWGHHSAAEDCKIDKLKSVIQTQATDIKITDLSVDLAHNQGKDIAKDAEETQQTIETNDQERKASKVPNCVATDADVKRLLRIGR